MKISAINRQESESQRSNKRRTRPTRRRKKSPGNFKEQRNTIHEKHFHKSRKYGIFFKSQAQSKAVFLPINNKDKILASSSSRAVRMWSGRPTDADPDDNKIGLSTCARPFPVSQSAPLPAFDIHVSAGFGASPHGA